MSSERLKHAKEAVGKFLEKNGFKESKDDECKYYNDKCEVIINPTQYVIKDGENHGMFYTPDLTIYSLIGYLTYNGYMDKNYEKL